MISKVGSVFSKGRRARSALCTLCSNHETLTSLICAPSHAGELPKNHEILREVSSLCDQVPVLDSKSFGRDFHSVSKPYPSCPYRLIVLYTI